MFYRERGVEINEGSERLCDVVSEKCRYRDIAYYECNSDYNSDSESNSDKGRKPHLLSRRYSRHPMW